MSIRYNITKLYFNRNLAVCNFLECYGNNSYRSLFSKFNGGYGRDTDAVLYTQFRYNADTLTTNVLTSCSISLLCYRLLDFMNKTNSTADYLALPKLAVMAFKFCANLSFMFQESTSLLERYSLAKAAGFKAVECGFPYEFTVEEIVNAKQQAGVQQVLINIYPGDIKKGELGFAAIPGKQEQFEKSIRLAIQYAKHLNCKLIHIMSGVVEKVTDVNDLIYKKNLRYASQLLEAEEIIGVIEPINPYAVPNYYLNNYEKAINFIKEIDSPFIKLQLDIFHLQHIKGNLTNSIKDYLPFVGHIQIAQVPNRNEPDTPGEINYEYIFEILKQNNYTGFIGLEYKPASDTVTGLKWITGTTFQF